MECPKCHVGLAVVEVQGVQVETCPSCGGDWLDAGQLGSILAARQVKFSREECMAAAAAAKITGVKMLKLDRHLVCPKCGGTTHPVNYGDDTGMIIDKCGTCGGVWVEKGEIEKIEELVEGWDDELPEDMAKYGPKLREVSAEVDAFEKANISHHRLVNVMINGILDWLHD